MSDLIRIVDQEVFYQLGVTEAERAKPQRLLLTIDLWLDTAPAALKDDLRLTINYSTLARGLVEFGAERQWQLIETLAADLAHWILTEFKPARVGVEVKKFVLPKADHVSIRIVRPV